MAVCNTEGKVVICVFVLRNFAPPLLAARNGRRFRSRQNFKAQNIAQVIG